MLSRSFLLGATAAVLVAALPQDIDFAAVNDVPTPTLLGAPLVSDISIHFLPLTQPSSLWRATS